MKKIILSCTTFILGLSAATNGLAQTSSTKYELTITNGSQMGISPGVIYVKTGGNAATGVGSISTVGFTQLCQNGNVTTRIAELKTSSSVKFLTQTAAPILPGESKNFTIDITNPTAQSLHFETMYGKTKDVCGVASINSQSLMALKQRSTIEVLQKDETIVTGLFTNPKLPSGVVFPDTNFCSAASDAISCLRSLSTTAVGKVRFFSGYSPNLIQSLENKYGATSVESLLFPTSGAIQLKLKIKN